MVQMLPSKLQQGSPEYPQDEVSITATFGMAVFP
jgi:hypothetical protein